MTHACMTNYRGPGGRTGTGEAVDVDGEESQERRSRPITLQSRSVCEGGTYEWRAWRFVCVTRRQLGLAGVLMSGKGDKTWRTW